MLKQWRYINSDESKKFIHRTSYCSFLPSISNYDTMSLRMEQTLSEVISLESAPIHGDTASQTERKYFSQASSVNGSSGIVAFAEGKNSWAFEMQIWLLIVDLFLKLDQAS